MESIAGLGVIANPTGKPVGFNLVDGLTVGLTLIFRKGEAGRRFYLGSPRRRARSAPRTLARPASIIRAADGSGTGETVTR